MKENLTWFDAEGQEYYFDYKIGGKMTERIIYQADRTIEEVENEIQRFQRLEEPIEKPQQFILDRQQELYDELVELIEAEDERQLEEVRDMLKKGTFLEAKTPSPEKVRPINKK